MIRPFLSATISPAIAAKALVLVETNRRHLAVGAAEGQRAQVGLEQKLRIGTQSALVEPDRPR